MKVARNSERSGDEYLRFFYSDRQNSIPPLPGPLPHGEREISEKFYYSPPPALSPGHLPNLCHLIKIKAVMKKSMRDIFENCRTIAVYGMSRSPYKAAHSVPEYLSRNRYRVIPINPNAESIGGRKSYPDLMQIPDKIDILQVFRPAMFAVQIVGEAIRRRSERNDIEVIWLQMERSEEARALAEEAGFTFVHGKCMYHEHSDLYED